MLRNRLYYHVKPLLPKAVRLSIRRWFALRKIPRIREQWPILPGSEKPPQGWSGWPDGKQFAFVLTHDVEGPVGLTRCRQLMRLETNLGCRSAFNFIPEGPYRVPTDLIEELRWNGFEVGVHDLQHDGKLYSSRQGFAEKSLRINQHLKNWGAVGFRSGFMLRRRDWLHDLDLLYDASCFDTDPFEPQPDGAGTIFPFWVPRPLELQSPARPPGYVELPYTLPQDSTLFLLLREQTLTTWKRKLDWIAHHGGMALMNVHPDYMRFGGNPNGSPSYPADIYAEFLNHVLSHYGDRCWHALPREVARFCQQRKFAHTAPSQRRIAMVGYTFYESDGRVMRYARALAQRGDFVEVFALKNDRQQSDCATVGQVRLRRLQCRQHKNQRRKAGFLLPILCFCLRASLRLAWEHLKHPYDVIHVHNLPDFLVFAAWLPRWMGAKVILDIHDIVPEFYASKFALAPDSLGVRMLKKVERASARFAHQVIIANDLWLETFTSRTGAKHKCSVFINHVDASLFQPRPRTRRDENALILFPGGLQWHQGLDIALRAFHRLAPRMPRARFHIYGDGSMKGKLLELRDELGLQDKVQFFNPVPSDKIVEVMANADLGVVPKRADSFGNEAYSTKIMEFMALGIPVVASRTKVDQYYFDDSVLRFFEPGNPEALAEAMFTVLNDPTLRQQMTTRASDYASRNSWETRKQDYLRLVDALVANP